MAIDYGWIRVISFDLKVIFNWYNALNEYSTIISLIHQDIGDLKIFDTDFSAVNSNWNSANIVVWMLCCCAIWKMFLQ